MDHTSGSCPCIEITEQMCCMTIAASCYQASCELLTLQAGVSQDGMLLSRLGSDLLKCHCHSSCASLLHKQSFSSCEVSQPSLLADGSQRLLQSCSLDVFVQTHGVCWGVSGLVCMSLCTCVKMLHKNPSKRMTSAGCKTDFAAPWSEGACK